MDKLDIKFQAIQESDLESIMHWRMQPDITKYMNTDPQLTIEDQYNWYKHILQQKDEYYWIIVVDNVKVGIASLVNPDLSNRQIHTGVYVAVKEKRSLRLILDIQWNLYSFAFDILNYNKVCEEVFSINKPVLRILDMCGSKVEGELRDQVFKNNQYYNITIRSILRSEWNEMKPKLKYNKIYIEDYKHAFTK